MHNRNPKSPYSVHNVNVVGTLWFFAVQLGKKAASFQQVHNGKLVGIRLVNSQEQEVAEDKEGA
jgi:hypothetical protein